MTLALLLFGVALLLAGGVGLVTGSTNIASRLGVSPLMVGLTVVAFGTSSPELMVNVIGALRGELSLAFGNVTGSNLANLGLVLGLSALITPVAIQGGLVRRELPLFLLGVCILAVMMLDTVLLQEASTLTRSEGIILLLLFSIFVYVTAGDLLRGKDDPVVGDVVQMNDAIPLPAQASLRSGVLYAVLGIVALAIGGHLTVVYGSALSEALGMPAVLVGILFVGVGTSLPELVTSVIAAARNEPDLCVGNVLGSCLFNCLVVLPITAVIRPLPIPDGGLIDVLMALLFAAAIVPVFLLGRARMSRGIGAAFVLTYFGYITWRTLVG